MKHKESDLWNKKKKSFREGALGGATARMCLLCKGAEARIQQGCRPAVKSEVFK